MSDHQTPEHSSPIKTPTQLVIVVVLSFIVPVLVIVMLTQIVTSGKKPAAATAAAEEAVAKRIKPAGEVVVKASGAASEERSGKVVYESVCMACHSTGALNAPKLGDKAAWGKLIAEGQARITADGLKGVRQMPARGGNPDLTDNEFARAVVYMANAAGANWKDPAPSAPAAAAAPTAAPAAAPATGGSSANGRAIYATSCAVCHAAGVAGAPKAGDKTAWAARIKTGKDALYASVIKGKGAMPPKGGTSLPDGDLKAAVDHLVDLAK